MAHVNLAKPANQLLQLQLLELMALADAAVILNWMAINNMRSFRVGFGCDEPKFWFRCLPFGIFRHDRDLYESIGLGWSVSDCWLYGKFTQGMLKEFNELALTDADLYKQLDVPWLQIVHPSDVIITTFSNHVIKQYANFKGCEALRLIIAKFITKNNYNGFRYFNLYMGNLVDVRPRWNRQQHHWTDLFFRRQVFTFLCINNRQSHRCNHDIKELIFGMLYDIHLIWLRKLVNAVVYGNVTYIERQIIDYGNASSYKEREVYETYFYQIGLLTPPPAVGRNWMLYI